MIFVDSNIPMYPVGAAHPHKTVAQVILERPIASGPATFDEPVTAHDNETESLRLSFTGPVAASLGNRAGSEEAALREHSLGHFQNEEARVRVVPPLTARLEQPVPR